jgi:hydrogenase-4 membrane subunit HyfE
MARSGKKIRSMVCLLDRLKNICIALISLDGICSFFFIVVPIWHKLIKEQPYVVNICKRHFLTGLFIMNSYKSSYFLSS